jgi:hypothetical protein
VLTLIVLALKVLTLTALPAKGYRVVLTLSVLTLVVLPAKGYIAILPLAILPLAAPALAIPHILQVVLTRIYAQYLYTVIAAMVVTAWGVLCGNIAQH